MEKSIAELESLGISKRKRIEKLLQKTGGDVDTVRTFLIASAQLKVRIRNQSVRITKEATKKAKLRQESSIDGPMDKMRVEDKGDHSERKIDRSASETCHWPPKETHLFLDGNNMLYVLAPLRDLCTRKRNVRGAEMALESMAKEFTEAMKLEKCTLLFDDTDRSVKEPNFTVYSARPRHRTSDDALVELAGTLGRGIFVTSDRELMGRLAERGVTVWGPKKWFQAVASKEGDEGINLDDWAKRWVK